MTIGKEHNLAKLPYTAEVEWLQSTGTQHIVIAGYVPNMGNIQKWGFYQTIDEITTAPFGCMNFTVVSGYHRFFNDEGIWHLRTDGGRHDWALYPYLISADKYLLIDDIPIDTTRGTTPASGDFWLFGRGDTKKDGKARIYYFSEETVEGNKVIDLVPVRIGQEGMMFDRVSRRLFRNSGTGSFVLGPDKRS